MPHPAIIRRIAARYLAAKAAKLRVFDFDDTLVSSQSSVSVVKADGERITMDSATFAHFTPVDGDKLDFGAFNDVSNPRIIKKNFDALKQFLADGEDVVILTARPKGASSAVSKFLKEQGVKGVNVVALQSSDPYDKARWIDRAIEDHNYDNVEFYDDSSANAKAVAEHGAKHEKAGKSFKSNNVAAPTEGDYAGPVIKTTFKSEDPTVALVEVKGKGPKKETEEKPSGSSGGKSTWWHEQTETFQHKYCEDHPGSGYCKTASETHVADKKDPNRARKDSIEARARKSKNTKVQRYVQELVRKIDQAGPAAGAWLESLERNFGDLTEEPKGLLKDFEDSDFDDLFRAMFDTKRPKAKKASDLERAWTVRG